LQLFLVYGLGLRGGSHTYGDANCSDANCRANESSKKGANKGEANSHANGTFCSANIDANVSAYIGGINTCSDIDANKCDYSSLGLLGQW